jgi:Holliday junction resolvase-like predicted endonuclease
MEVVVTNEVIEQVNRKLASEDIVERLSDFVNWAKESDMKVCGQHFLKQHKTLQQGMIRFSIAMIEAMAGNEKIDARNYFARDFCKEVVDKIEDRCMPVI